MTRLVLLTILLVYGWCGVVLQKMQPPLRVVQDLTDYQEYTFIQSEMVDVQFQQGTSVFEGQAYDRNSAYYGEDIYADFVKTPENYTMSSFCTLNPSNLDLDVEAQTLDLEDHKPISHIVDWNSRCTYVLTESLEVLKTCPAQHRLHLFGGESTLQVLGQINETSSVGGFYFNTTSHYLYVFTKTSMSVWNGTGFEAVSGFKEKDYSSKFLTLDDQLIVVSPYKSVNIYRFTDYKTCTLVSMIEYWNQKVLLPVDLELIKGQLWILDSSFGIFTYQLGQDKPAEKNSYPLRYGKKLLFESFNDTTLQIVFQLNGDTYVAEMILKKDDSLSLNRFYDQIDSVKQIMFLGERMVIMGEEEIMTVQHSINYHLIQDTWQDKSFYSTFGVLEVQQSKTTNQPAGVLSTMLTDKSIRLATYNRQQTTMVCDLQKIRQQPQPHTVYLEMNSSNCNQLGNKDVGDQYCTVRYSLTFKTMGVVSVLMQLIITLVVIVGGVGISFSLLLSARSLRRNRQQDILRLEEELRLKIEEREKHRKSENSSEV